MNKLAAIVVIGVGLGAVAGVYWFRANRLTAGDIAEIAAAQQRVEAIEKQSAASEQDEPDPAVGKDEEKNGERPTTDVAAGQELAKNQPAEEKKDAGAASATDGAAPKSAGAPPSVTVIPNESMPDKTPETFTTLFQTTKGDFAVEFTRDWAPTGADRMYELVMTKFFTDMRIFRVVENFVVQFGIPGDPAVSMQWLKKNIPDDPAKQSNTEGMFTFAAGGSPNTRSTQVFVNLADNSRGLDHLGFAPVGKVIFGMDVVKSLYSGYGESVTELQGQIAETGNAFLDKHFPELDTIKRAAFVEVVTVPGRSEERSAEERIKLLEQSALGGKERGVSEQAPETFKVTFDCTMGTFVVECYRDWSPYGADRFYTLAKNGFFDAAKFFRVVPGFITQFGLPAEADLGGKWLKSTIPDDPFSVSNTEGTVVFAKPSNVGDARSTQVFINLADNSASLDPQSFTPFGKVIEGMDVVNRINAEYGESPDQAEIRVQGNTYLEKNYPRLDGIRSAKPIEDAPQPRTTEGEAPAAAAP